MLSKSTFGAYIFCLAMLGLAGGPLAAAPVSTAHVEAELISRHLSIAAGQPIEVALRLKIVDHWHTYWRNPGDSGLPTKLNWTLPPGFTAGAIEWPYPGKLPLGPLMNFGYDGEVLHLVTIETPAKLKAGEKITFKAKADWLVCNDVCIPESADLSLTLPVSAAAPLVDARWQDAFVRAKAALPKTSKFPAGSARIEGGKLLIDLAEIPATVTDATFFPYRDDIIANAGKQVLTRGSGRTTLSVPLADPIVKDLKILEGVLVSGSGWGDAQPGNALAISAPAVMASAASPPPPAANDLGLMAALALAFVGGMLLNLMPCVFPVLGLKVMGFVRHAQSEASTTRKQGIAFLGGVLISFWLLAGVLIALRATGQSLGWGFQLQSPTFVTLLAILFLLLALNLSGLFEIGLGLQSAAGGLATGSSRSALIDAFFSGVLATIVATPCTAPFMGAALGFTLAQPAAISMLVFTAIAIGMATPVVLLSFVPRWLEYLPRPGAWMETFKQLMAFPLFATVVWLAWVLGSQQGNDGVARLLFGMLLIAMGAWLYGRWQVRKPLHAIAVAMVFGLAGLVMAWPDTSATHANVGGGRADGDWIPYSKQGIADLRNQGKGVFVDFTAAWCITCQVNKRVALNQPEVIKRFAELNIVRMKADWTVQDPAITAALAEFGRNGVPLYVYYPKTGDARVLPEILTPSAVLSAISS
jgi:thiol:disulfide interchange protein DsbD